MKFYGFEARNIERVLRDKFLSYCSWWQEREGRLEVGFRGQHKGRESNSWFLFDEEGVYVSNPRHRLALAVLKHALSPYRYRQIKKELFGERRRRNEKRLQRVLPAET